MQLQCVSICVRIKRALKLLRFLLFRRTENKPLYLSEYSNAEAMVYERFHATVSTSQTAKPRHEA